MFDKNALKPLFEPKSIAVIGASGRVDRPGYDTIVCSESLDWPGKIYPVTPKYKEIRGWQCYASMAELPHPVDLAIMAGSANRLAADMEQVVKAQVKSVLVYANPDSTNDRELKNRLLAITNEAGIPMLGPNTIGYVNYARQCVATWVPPNFNHRGKIAGIIQSGTVYSVSTITDPRVQFAFAAHPGMEISVSVGSLINYALSLPDVHVIGMYLENIYDPDEFVQALKNALQASVPIVALKPGRSRGAQTAIATHTGRLAANDDIADAVLRKYQVLRVEHLEEWWTTLYLMSRVHELGPGGLSLTMDSGGMKALMIDEAEKLGVPLTNLSQTSRAKLRERLSPELATENPVDFWGGEEDLASHVAGCLEDLVSDDGTAITIAMAEYGVEDSDVYNDNIAAGVIRAARTSAKPVLAGAYSARQFFNARMNRMLDAGIGVLDSIPAILRAVKHAFAWRDREGIADSTVVTHSLSESQKNNLQKAYSGQESDALALLQSFGIDTAQSYLLETEQTLEETAQKLSWPVVLKTAEGHAHKTELGGVILGIQDVSQLKNAYKEMHEKLGPRVTVQTTAPKGMEIALGMINDPQFGPIIMLATGGALVELSADKMFVLAPVSITEANNMVNQLQFAPLFAGYRGLHVLAKNKLVDSIIALSNMAMLLQNEVTSIDINPIVVHPSGAVAVDALIEWKD